MIYQGLGASERANKAALLLAHERYTAQYAPFVKGQPARLSYVENQIERMIQEVVNETGAELEYVTEKFTTYLKESVKDKVDSKGVPDVLNTTDEPGLENIKKTDPMDRGEVEGAGREEATKPDERQDLGDYSVKTSSASSCFRCGGKLDKIAVVCNDCTKALHKRADLKDYKHWNEDAERMWWEEEGKHQHEYEPPDPEDRDHGAEDAAWDELYDVLQGLEDVDLEEVARGMFSGDLPYAEQLDPVGVKDLAKQVLYDRAPSHNPGSQYAEEDPDLNQREPYERTLRGSKVKTADPLDQTGYGTSVQEPDPNAVVAPADPNMPVKCSICEANGTQRQGDRTEILNHVMNDHTEEERQAFAHQPLNTPGSPVPQPSPQYRGGKKTADIPDDQDAAKVEPLPQTPGDKFDDFVQDLANHAAALKFSRPDDQLVHSLASQTGGDVDQITQSLKAVAIFGNYIGVNGEIGGDPSPPEGYEEVAKQGQDTGAQEALVPTDLVVAKVADEMNLEHDLAYDQIRDRYSDDLPTEWHASVQGEIHYYLPTELAGNQQQQQQVDPNVGPTAPSAQQPSAQQPQQQQPAYR